jgi:hypothetical protein
MSVGLPLIRPLKSGDRGVGSEDRGRRGGCCWLDDVEPDDRAGHQCRSAATKAVEQGHHLGHRRHLDLEGGDRADETADHETGDDPAVVHQPEVDQCGDHRDEHRQGGQRIAALRGAHPGQALEPEDEQDRGEQIEDRYED